MALFCVTFNQAAPLNRAITATRDPISNRSATRLLASRAIRRKRNRAGRPSTSSSTTSCATPKVSSSRSWARPRRKSEPLPALAREFFLFPSCKLRHDPSLLDRRCHFVIEKGGKLLEAKIGVKPADDAKNALEFIKSLDKKDE